MPSSFTQERKQYQVTPISKADKKLKLALIMSTEVGLRTQYLNWCDHFPTDLGIDPNFVVMTFHKDGGVPERLPLPEGIKSRIRGQMEVGDALKQGPFDGIFIAVHSALAMFSSILDQVPCFMTFDVTPKQLHDFGPIYEKSPSKIKLIESYKHSRRALAYQKCRLLFPWSNWAGESAVTDYGTDSSRMHVSPPGVDLERWSPKNRWERAPKAGVNLLFVGGDFDRKGGQLLLEWAQTTKQRNFHLHLVTRKKLENTDPRICVYNDLMPNDPKLVALYENADMFVLPTLADCYSLAGIEAMASGLPVILSETGGTGDIIKRETGFLLPPGDLNALTHALDVLIENPALREKMGRAARADAEARYDVGANIRRSVELMREQMLAAKK